MSSTEKETTSTEACEAETPTADEESDDTLDCPNCGRTFSGTYCPDCGQEVGKSLTITEIAGNALGDASSITGGFWKTVVGLTLRPRQVLQDYLSGARKTFMSPGRYLTIAVLFYVITIQGLTWLGVQRDFSKAMTELYGEKFSSFSGTVGQMVQSQWLTIALTLLSAGVLALVLRRLFEEELEKGAEALAVAVYLISHASILTLGSWLLYVPVMYLSIGEPVNPVTYSAIATLITIFYPGAAAHHCFGIGWKSAFKSILGSFWARIEALGIGGITMAWIVFWSTANYPPLPDEISPAEKSTVRLIAMGLMTVVYLLPLLLHAAVEAYYRLRSSSPQSQEQ